MARSTSHSAPRRAPARRAGTQSGDLAALSVLVAAVVGPPLLALGLLAAGVSALAAGVPLAGAAAACAVVAAVFVLWMAVVHLRGAGAPPAVGLSVGRAQQPALWAMVEETSRSLSIAAPAELRLVDGVTVTAADDGRVLGLLGRRRRLVLGLAGLETLSVDQARGLIGAELIRVWGHGTAATISERAGAALSSRPLNPAAGGMTLRLAARHAALHQRLTASAQARRLLAADQGAAALAGAAVLSAALPLARETAGRYARFLDVHVRPLWRRGVAPADLAGSFRAYLADPAASARPVAAVTFAEDFLISPSARLSALARAAYAVPGRDAHAASSLLGRPGETERAVARQLGQTVLARPPARYLSAAEAASLIHGGEAGRLAARLSAVGAAAEGSAEPVAAGRVVALLAAGRGADLAAALSGAQPQEAAEVLTGHLHALVATLLTSRDVLRWRVNWDHGAELASADGRPVDLMALVRPAVDGPAEALNLYQRLQALGVAGQVLSSTDPVAAAPLLGALPELHYRRGRVDLLVRADGVLLAEAVSSRGQRVRGALFTLAGQRDPAVEERVRVLELASLGGPAPARGAFVASADVVRAELRRHHLSGWRLDLVTRDGERRRFAFPDASRLPEARVALDDLLGARFSG